MLHCWSVKELRQRRRSTDDPVLIRAIQPAEVHWGQGEQAPQRASLLQLAGVW